MSQENNDQQVALIRNSLINSAFAKYHELIALLKSLPIHQQVPGMQRAYMDIDSGMLWIKEILSTAPIILQTNQEKKECEIVQDVAFDEKQQA